VHNLCQLQSQSNTYANVLHCYATANGGINSLMGGMVHQPLHLWLNKL